MIQVAQSRLFELVYQELKGQAVRMMDREQKGHTLQATALANEAFLKLAAQDRIVWKNKSHVLAIASITMRRILVNHARRRRLARLANAELAQPEEDPIAISFERRTTDLLALDEALKKLARMDPKQARIVELRFFGGLSADETAEIAGVSKRTVHREWNSARAWLRKCLQKGEPVES